MTKKNNTDSLTWSTDCQTAFNQLKTTLISAPVLAHPNFNKSFLLDTDTSNFAIRAVLSQIQKGKETVIAYASKVLSTSEKQYCVKGKELLAVVYFT